MSPRAGRLSPGWRASASWRRGDGAAAPPENLTSHGPCCFAAAPFLSARKDALAGWDKKGNGKSGNWSDLESEVKELLNLP